MLGEVGLDIRRRIPRIQVDRDGNDPQKAAPLTLNRSLSPRRIHDLSTFLTNGNATSCKHAALVRQGPP